mmetsp:Transcript_60293/g.174009  ORF Transcript_60293/g.174009 Transcript_60293/m.174009 type:complete len:204 (-) Transcript_60293:1222-1833(-)
MPPLGSSTTSKRSRPWSQPFMRLPCNSWLSDSTGGWWPAKWMKQRLTMGKLRQILASSIERAYFSAPNHSDNLPAASNNGDGSKRSSAKHAATVCLMSCACDALSKLATKPATLLFAGRPPGGTLKETTSSAFVCHSMPKSMTSQPCGIRSSKPGNSARIRSICRSSRSVTKITFFPAHGPPSATAARAPASPLAKMHGTMHS